MKLTIKQCIAAFTALTTVKQNNKLTFLFAWKLEDVLRELKIHVDRGQKEQIEILKKFGLEDPKKPGLYSVQPEKIEAYNKAINPVFSHELSLDLPKVTKQDFMRENVSLDKGIDITDIMPILTDEKTKI